MGVAPGPGEGERHPPRPRGELSPRVTWIVAAAIGAMYAISSILRGAVLPGIVGGVLAAILCVLVLREVRQRRRRRGL